MRHINKSELVRNDTIAFVSKFENGKLTLIDEDNFDEYSGLVANYIHIQKINEFHDINDLKNRIYNKFCKQNYN